MKKVYNTGNSIKKYFIDIEQGLKNKSHIKYKNKKYKFVGVVEEDDDIRIVYVSGKEDYLGRRTGIEVVYKNKELFCVVMGFYNEELKTCRNGYEDILVFRRADNSYLCN